MTRYLGGLITKDESLVIPTNNFEDTSAPGVWTLEEAQALNKQGLWPTAGVDNPVKFVENIFSTDLFVSDSNDLGSGGVAVTTGIDLANNSGMVWLRMRDLGEYIYVNDTVRGINKALQSSNNAAESSTNYKVVTEFNSTGFKAVGHGYGGTDRGMCSWTFRKAPKFFDVVTGTTDNSGHIDLTHSLGQEPGMVIVKRTDATSNWFVYHRSLGVTKYLNLDTTGAASNFTAWANVSSTTFRAQIGFGSAPANIVAYFFGHDTSSDGMIQCGNFTGTGSQITTTLGFEPQWLMFKRTDNSAGGGWGIVDNIRGWVEGGNSSNFQLLEANNTDDGEAESSGPGLISTGFTSNYSNGREYIYMAIRRGPMQTPTSSTSVFAKDFRFSSDAQAENPKLNYYSGFPVDFDLNFRRSGGGVYVSSRLQGGSNFLQTNSNAAEIASSSDQFGSNKGLVPGFTNSEDTTIMSAMWRRAPGFFDVVVYTGNESSGRQITHNLGVAPEMIWIKERGGTSSWAVYHKGLNGGTNPHDYVLAGLNNGYDEANNNTYFGAAPTSTTFTVGNNQATNENSIAIIAFLFATLAGISKVGSFSHTNGSSTDVDCGFSSGSSFVIVKDRDQGSDSGDWYVWDSKRGIVSGNDPYLLLNSNAAEVTNTDYIDTLSSGFQIASGFATGDYIFYAIAA
jgi:hypothetical protein